MIDPVNITSFELSAKKLEETILFWVCAAGKNAKTASRNLDRFLIQIHSRFELELYNPFLCIRKLGNKELPSLLKNNGIGCYNNKAKSFWELANSNIDLAQCSADDLEKIHGIGMKTSRCFIIHSRRDAEYAGLDVHILKYLRDLGYDVPKTTPAKKEYVRIEKIFLDIVKKSKMSVAEYDLMIWRKYSGN
jgi:endonuclease III